MTGVQYGTVTIAALATSGTATISSVDTTKSSVLLLGASVANNAGTANYSQTMSRVDLTNATTVTATCGAAITLDVITVSFVVISFSGVKSLQQGTLTIVHPATTGTATISSVSTTKSILLWQGYANDTNEGVYQGMATVTLTNSTTVTGSHDAGSGASTITMGYVVVEFS